MTTIIKERVTHIHHWNETLFSFKTSRQPTLKFENGHFVMVGLEQEGRPLMRAYSIASANYEEELEFFSIKVPDGALTSKLQNIRIGDEILISTKATGSLVTGHLLPGKHLYLISTGTGLAPFMSIIRDPEVYEQFEKIILVHGVRYKSELAYQEFISKELKNNEYFGEQVKTQLLYYPTVTREDFANTGRITTLLENGKLSKDLALPNLSTANDRFMICGSPSMLKDTCKLLEQKGFQESRHGHQGHFVIERAFVES